MTTIVYDHKEKQIACDSRLTSNGVIVNDNAKKHLTNELGTWFFTGKDSDKIHLSILAHNDKVDVSPDCSAIVSNSDGVYLVCVSNSGYCEWSPLDYSVAIGSGCDFATGAIDFGCDAKKAVEYAITRDIYTGGKVRVYDVLQKRLTE